MDICDGNGGKVTKIIKGTFVRNQYYDNEVCNIEVSISEHSWRLPCVQEVRKKIFSQFIYHQVPVKHNKSHFNEKSLYSYSYFSTFAPTESIVIFAAPSSFSVARLVDSGRGKNGHFFFFLSWYSSPSE